ncbi:MAG: mutT [Clostridia bacterium]|nr:mutT [Clostridia bacterium]
MIQVAAAIIRKNGKILICQRGAGGNCAYLWEFPGGKVELNETFEQCAIRECKEELGININIKDIFIKTVYKYPDKEIEFTFFNAEITEEILKISVHNDIKWVLPNEMKAFKFCPADIEVVNSMINAEGKA